MIPAPYHLRPTTSDDFEFVRRLHHETLQEYIAKIWGWDEPKWDGFLKKWFKPERIKIIQSNAQDIGILVVEKNQNEIFFESISITPGLQNRGIGSRVINDILNEARASNQPVNLEVLKPNPARRLYERLGFKVTGESETHFQMKWSPA